ncbi:hypothetical protein J416_01874 [Gracilibacillus halophilus YIM-C55.5]|uniref:Uncharacterized protein n=1 Tax=Gracilibacillus halophilus YIM-C55.5 TaxID=1308866 RepID=N4WD37_9BACI|nr:hypothetical protein J416_01874 [Gracilibacillus halophilus YIM-C55.5]
MKLTKFVFIGTIIYLLLFLIDYLVTLFSIDKSGVYKSKLGLEIDMTMNEEELFTTFSLTPQVLITYFTWIIIVCLGFFMIQKLRNRGAQ